MSKPAVRKTTENLVNYTKTIQKTEDEILQAYNGKFTKFTSHLTTIINENDHHIAIQYKYNRLKRNNNYYDIIFTSQKGMKIIDDCIAVLLSKFKDKYKQYEIGLSIKSIEYANDQRIKKKKMFKYDRLYGYNHDLRDNKSRFFVFIKDGKLKNEGNGSCGLEINVSEKENNDFNRGLDILRKEVMRKKDNEELYIYFGMNLGINQFGYYNRNRHKSINVLFTPLEISKQVRKGMLKTVLSPLQFV